MRIKAGHIPWAIGSAIVVGGCGYWYHAYAKAAPNGPSGSTREGVTFGIMAAVCMAIVGGLGFRKRYRSARLGSARFWLKMHLWLGLIVLPLVIFHAGGLRTGGALTTVIMVLLYAVWISGIYGILLQQVLPGYLKVRVPNERLNSQIGVAMDNLRIEAEKLAGSAAAISELYKAAIQPYLMTASPSAAGYTNISGACQKVKIKLGPAAAKPVDSLEKICCDYRNLTVEKRLLWWLHSWLLVHVPLSMALLLLSGIHIIMAWRLAL